MQSKWMTLKCTTCHQGSDPREEAVSPPTAKPAAFTLRKMVDPNTCLMCHGSMPHEIMGLPSAWAESREMFGNNCLTCHAAIRTVRHQVDFLKAENIEKLGAASGDVCYGCHGGRQLVPQRFPLSAAQVAGHGRRSAGLGQGPARGIRTALSPRQDNVRREHR